MRKICLAAMLTPILIFVFISAVQAQNSQQTLTQYISALRESPNDTALRERIIRHVQTMSPAPGIPEEARRYYVRGSAIFEDAKQPSDSADAAEEFRQALLIAPWWGEAYMKMGLALKSARLYDEAIASLKLFMATNPPKEVLRKAQDEIYMIEAKAQKAMKDKEAAAKKMAEEKRAQQEDAAAKKAREQGEFLRRINGARYIFHWPGPVEDLVFTLDVLGDMITSGQIKTRSTDPADRRIIGLWQQSAGTYKIEGRMLRFFMWGKAMESTSGIISDDGSTITIITRMSGGHESRQVYKRER